MKPWEEVWRTNKLGEQYVLIADDTWAARFSPSPGVSPDHEAARARLASAAPDMASLLMRIAAGYDEWTGDEISAVLRKAGVLDERGGAG